MCGCRTFTQIHDSTILHFLFPLFFFLLLFFLHTIHTIHARSYSLLLLSLSFSHSRTHTQTHTYQPRTLSRSSSSFLLRSVITARLPPLLLVFIFFLSLFSFLSAHFVPYYSSPLALFALLSFFLFFFILFFIFFTFCFRDRQHFACLFEIVVSNYDISTRYLYDYVSVFVSSYPHPPPVFFSFSRFSSLVSFLFSFSTLV